MHNTFPTIVRITPAVLKATGKTEATYADLVTALRLIEHATAPTPDDGGGHENAYSIAIDALHRVLDESLRSAPQEPQRYRVIRARNQKDWAYVLGSEYPTEGFTTFEAAAEAGKAAAMKAAPQPPAPSSDDVRDKRIAELLKRIEQHKMAYQEVAVAHSVQQERAEEAEARVAELEAARIAYAGEFPPDAEGFPDVGSIHQHIRAMKAALADARDGELLNALRHISLCSQNSASSKEECGRIARSAIAAIQREEEGK